MLGNYYGYHGYGDFSGSVYDYHKLCCVITTAQGGADNQWSLTAPQSR